MSEDTIAEMKMTGAVTGAMQSKSMGNVYIITIGASGHDEGLACYTSLFHDAETPLPVGKKVIVDIKIVDEPGPHQGHQRMPDVWDFEMPKPDYRLMSDATATL